MWFGCHQLDAVVSQAYPGMLPDAVVSQAYPGMPRCDLAFLHLRQSSSLLHLGKGTLGSMDGGRDKTVGILIIIFFPFHFDLFMGLFS